MSGAALPPSLPWIRARNDRVAAASPAACRLLGFCPGDLDGVPLREIVAEWAVRGEADFGLTRLRRADGRFAFVGLFPLDGWGADGRVMVLADFTRAAIEAVVSATVADLQNVQASDAASAAAEALGVLSRRGWLECGCIGLYEPETQAVRVVAGLPTLEAWCDSSQELHEAWRRLRREAWACVGGVVDGCACAVAVPLRKPGASVPMGVLCVHPPWFLMTGGELWECVAVAVGDLLRRGLARQREAITRGAAEGAISALAQQSRAVEAVCGAVGRVDLLAPPSQVFEDVMRAVRQVVPFERAGLVQRGPEPGTFYVRARFAPGLDTIVPIGTVLRDPNSPIMQALITGQLVVSDLRPESESGYLQRLYEAGAVHWACVPARVGGRIVGAIAVCRHRGRPRFQPHELRLLSVAATAIGLSIVVGPSGAGMAERFAQPRAWNVLIEAERMKVTMELVRGMCHVFGNKLAVAMGRLEQAMSRRQGDGQELRGVLEALKAAAEVLHRLRQYTSRADSGRVVRVDAGEVIEEAVEEARQRWQRQFGVGAAAYEVEVDVQGRAIVNGDPDALRDALAALLDNAAEAMPLGGRIEISAVRHKGWVRILVRDHGIGMAQHILAHATEPFYSAKGAAASGLGLSAVDGIVARHNGVLLLCSRPNAGTCVAIYLPAAGGASRAREGEQK